MIFAAGAAYKRFAAGKTLKSDEFISGDLSLIAGSPKIGDFWGGMQIVKTILVKNRLVNLIVKPQ